MPSDRKPIPLVGGLDEVGRGALAGPLVIAVIAYPVTALCLNGLKDSKKMSPKRRKEMAPIIASTATFFGVGWAGPRLIDRHGINYAWQYAARDALRGCPDLHNLIVDGDDEVDAYEEDQKAIPKADDTYWQVSAASVVAKVLRDFEMGEAGAIYKGYGWCSNSGYGTKQHLEGLERLGPTPYHRLSFLKKFNRRTYEQPAPAL